MIDKCKLWINETVWIIYSLLVAFVCMRFQWSSGKRSILCKRVRGVGDKRLKGIVERYLICILKNLISILSLGLDWAWILKDLLLHSSKNPILSSIQFIMIPKFSKSNWGRGRGRGLLMAAEVPIKVVSELDTGGESRIDRLELNRSEYKHPWTRLTSRSTCCYGCNYPLPKEKLWGAHPRSRVIAIEIGQY